MWVIVYEAKWFSLFPQNVNSVLPKASNNKPGAV